MEIKVWDPVVRTFHWCLAAAFFTNYWFIEDSHWHEWIGYGVALLVLVRFIWGFIGTEHARFASFIPTPAKVSRHVQEMRRGNHRPSIGHNPLGSLMIFLLLISLTGLVLSGWFMTLDIFWGEAWPEEVHEFLANMIQLLVAIHIAAVILSDRILKEGLLHSMITGYKKVEMPK